MIKKTVEENYSRNSRYFTWYVTTTEGNKFRIPSVTYTKPNAGDTITVSRTAVFRKAVEISCSYHFDEFGIDDGVINGSWL
ncbi:MAG: hypothetical protein IPP72_18505 [Chitinophagaceae bacterium]|nr:hypothetical protein [Chitinophagaceae bacterium]